jgi:CrcB protein
VQTSRESHERSVVTGLWVGLGGGLGAVARFAVGGWVAGWAPSLPIGTFTVNVLGSIALGFLARALAGPSVSVGTRGFFTAGLCGGFTTFSAFDLEVLRLLQDGRHGVAAGYAFASLIVCILGVLGGARLARGITLGEGRV